MWSARQSILMTFAAFLALRFPHARGQIFECIGCTWNTSDSGSSDCYNPDASSAASDSCTGPGAYCLTELTLEDGVVSKIKRSCTNEDSDFDKSSDERPNRERCVLTSNNLNGNPVEMTKCYIPCANSQKCNTIGPKNLKLCDVNCGFNGECNYITGNCVCKEGFSGGNCSTEDPAPDETFRKCLQCETETGVESGDYCESYRDSYECPDLEQRYCAVTRTRTYDQGGSQIRDIVERSCTADYVAADECFVSSRGDQDVLPGVEYTCISTCDTDGCNTGTPDGKFETNDPIRPLMCVVCSSQDDLHCDTSTTIELCPSSATHCQSIVTYYKSDKTDLPFDVDPDYMLASVERSCSTSNLPTRCTSSTVGSSSLVQVTCQESCQRDGCNTGWPARPKCSQCGCNRCESNDECKLRPPEGTSCPLPYQEFCTILDINHAVSDKISFVDGYPRSIIRGCSYKGIGNNCSSEGQIESCNKTCSVDGCNLGNFRSSASANHHPSNILLVFVSLFALVFRHY
ncbi:uncharacterized protein LOC143468419 [Clavelina lepadiformis]|uniref:uncharacterized protein LOC143468419 n=1 Tax=Clavelina lepadiformis TaxID=159417 RepID=UPI004042D948